MDPSFGAAALIAAAQSECIASLKGPPSGYGK
jgi:hypothetical protein